MRKTLAKIKQLHPRARKHSRSNGGVVKIANSWGKTYSKSLGTIKKKPAQTLGVVLGLGALSGAALWWFKRK